MYCEKCGNKLRNGAKFCNKCGAALVENKAEKVGKSANAHSAAQVKTDISQSEPRKTRARAGKGSDKKKIFVTAGICCGILAAAAVVFIVMFMNKPKTVNPAYFEYIQILGEARSDIAAYESNTGQKSVSVADLNDSGTDDIVYISQKSEADSNQTAEDKAESISYDLTFGYDNDGSASKYVLPKVVSGDKWALCRSSNKKDLYLYCIKPYIDSVYIECIRQFRINNAGTTIQRYRNAETGEISYTDTEHNGEDFGEYEAEFKKIKEDSVGLLLSSDSNSECDGVFDNITDDYSKKYDEAVSYLNEIIGNSTADSADAEADAQANTEKTVVITDVDPSELPDGLKEFLQIFDYAYGGQKTGREYDHENLENVYEKMLDNIVGNPRAVDLKLYPCGDSIESFDPNTDPLDKYEKGWGYIAVPKEKVIWIFKNIFNISDSETEKILQASMNADPDIYEYEQNGVKYIYNKIGGLGGPGYAATYENIRFDGEKYYIVYDCSDPFDLDSDSTIRYYTEMAYKDIDGVKYWSMYKHTADIPELPAATVVKQSDAFERFSGDYVFSSGIGGWSTSMEIHSDGTFSGQFTDHNMGERGDGYDSTVYFSKFSGSFSNPKKINSYTYSFELDYINYENMPNTEEIVTEGSSGHRTLKKYSEAYGLSNGTKTIYAYTADAPIPLLPEQLMSWIRVHRTKASKSSIKLQYKCLYTVETEYGWIGKWEQG